MKISNSEKILLGIGIFMLAGTVLYLFLENMNDERKKLTSNNEDKSSRSTSNYISSGWTPEKLAVKSKLIAMKNGLIKSSLTNEEIQQQIAQLDTI